MKSAYPYAYEYLLAHRSKLDKRNVDERQRNKAFYVYGRSQATGYCTEAPKIFYSTNQRGDKYGLDTIGIAYASGGTAGEVALYAGDQGYSLDFVLALLDQKVIEFFVRKRGSAFRGGYVARGTDVISDVPIPKLDFSVAADCKFHDDVSRSMRELRALHEKTNSVPERQLTQHKSRIATTSNCIRNLFLARWGLTVAELDALRM